MGIKINCCYKWNVGRGTFSGRLVTIVPAGKVPSKRWLAGQGINVDLIDDELPRPYNIRKFDYPVFITKGESGKLTLHWPEHNNIKPCPNVPELMEIELLQYV